MHQWDKLELNILKGVNWPWEITVAPDLLAMFIGIM
jgi:hypothetical protein